MSLIDRREFLKILGAAGTSATFGCTRASGRRLIPYVIPAVDIIPGEPTWYATTCRECPAGCGMLAKNRDGRIVKLEGNPDHPVNRGALCPRGQAALHGLYNPDRYPAPRQLSGDSLIPISWKSGQRRLAAQLRELRDKGQGERIAFISGLENGTLAELIDEWLAAFGAPPHVRYEPYAYEPLRAANLHVQGHDTVPFYHLDWADLLISLNAGFLETWVSNIDYTRRFATFREPRDNEKNFFVQVGPRQSLTAASADFRIELAPDTEWLVGVALLDALNDEAEQGNLRLAPEVRKAVDQTLAASDPARQAARQAIPPETLRRLTRRFIAADRPLVLAAGLPHDGPHATAAAVAANLLNLMKPGSRELIAAAPGSALDRTAKGAELRALVERMNRGEIELLLINQANPVFGLPKSWDLAQALSRVKTIVTFSSCPDETSLFAHLALPTHTPLESWGDFTPRTGIAGLMQPVMGPMFDTAHLGDVLLSTARLAGAAGTLPWGDFYERLQHTWQAAWQTGGWSETFPRYWAQLVQRGGDWWQIVPPPKPIELTSDFDYAFPEPAGQTDNGAYPLTIYPTVQFFDGRGANRPWIQELPDPVSQATYGGWVEIHPRTAEQLGVEKGEMLRLSTPHGQVEVPALPIYSVPEGTLALPIGQGHEHYGRYADGKPANPLLLMGSEIDPASGGIVIATRVTVKRGKGCYAIANTDGHFFMEGRDLAKSEPFVEYVKARAAGRPPEVDRPMPDGFHPREDIYGPHQHKEYRWCMVVDLDRCIGCGACVVACYAENNVALVGRGQMLLGREMSWLRIQRYFSEDDNKIIRYLPMLCQHCDEAPCESVCPIFAPQHSVDGLNNQVYNRCFGTRFCSQNDPYKVRRFNWFTFTRDTPLDWQLNPDVTVRQKGVMEKCSFCVQRIVAAKIRAKDKGLKKVEDDDFTTACAQTCPTKALTFGNLVDPESRVSKMIKDARAYQVLRELNTKPAVIYLKRLTQEL